MPRLSAAPRRVHLLSAANPLGPDLARFGFESLDAYLAFIRAHLPGTLRLTASKAVLSAVEDVERGGRRDDARRIRDLQGALDDPGTLAIVASNGGAYFSRILPHVDFSALARRRTPLTVFGFSELTGLVNVVASYPAGRGVYWLCPNYLGWTIRPAARARAAFGEFWRRLPEFIEQAGGPAPASLRGRASSRQAGSPGAPELEFDGRVRGRVAAGRVRSGPVRLVGGCISVLVALLTGPLAQRIRPERRWLAIEDVREVVYRLDRHLASLKHAGWFERLAGVLIGDFHTAAQPDQSAALLELLRFHAPRRLPIVVTRSFGHVWPMTPLVLNRRLWLETRSAEVEIAPARPRT
ncbi:MAG: LD-carboxypeptidase [Phycisphaerae bacterium]|nr:LD-carboxypeptidase [Phycisphaerae bacterium]MCZ2401181.1 LD-carboxypeptidase [Phycisphaerae bacterium]